MSVDSIRELLRHIKNIKLSALGGSIWGYDPRFVD